MPVVEPIACSCRDVSNGRRKAAVAGTPVNPGNALKRVIRPAAKELGIQFGGWHDSRHTLSTTMRRNKVHPKVISETLGHVKVTFAAEVYDHASVEEMREPLAAIASQLLPTVTNDESAT